MNILFLCDEYPPCQHGGIGTVTQLLAHTLVAKGHKVFVAGFYPYYRKAETTETDQGVTVFRFFYGSKFLLQFSKRNFTGKFINIEKEFTEYVNFLKILIKDYQIEIIECPDFVEAFRYSGPRIIQFPFLGIPMIVKLHGTYSYFRNLENNKSNCTTLYKKEKLHLDKSDGIIALSKFVESETMSIFNYSKPVKVIYNGISSSFSMTYKLYHHSNIVVFAGTLSERKGIFSLIKAWEIVIKELPSAHLLVYGNGGKKTINKIKNLIMKMPANAIELKGFVLKEDLPSIYSNTSCSVFPSYAESFSMAPMEAMAVGCPVIFTKRTSGPELITNGYDGLLVDPDNIQEIADAILFMLNNRERAIEMGQNGYKRVKGSFDISIIADNHIEHYEHIIKVV